MLRVEDLVEALETADELVVAWRAHPAYDGNDDDPYVRLVFDHEPGPYGNNFSVTICTMFEVRRTVMRVGALHLIGEWTWCLEPIDPEDPCVGRFVHYWDLPNNAGFNYVARATFKMRFPKARKIVNQARRSWRRPLDPTLTVNNGEYTSKRERFAAMVEREGWGIALDTYGLTIDDVWAVATNKARPADVDRMGDYQLALR